MLTKGRKKAEDKTDLGEKIRNSAAVMLRYMQMEMLSRQGIEESGFWEIDLCLEYNVLRVLRLTGTGMMPAALGKITQGNEGRWRGERNKGGVGNVPTLKVGEEETAKDSEMGGPVRE